jgi:dynein heavy chain
MIVNGVKTIFERCLDTVTRQCRQVIQAENVNLLASCLKLISALILNDEVGDLHKTTIFQPERMIQTYVVFSLIWSLGANIHDDSRKNFCRAFVDQVAQVFTDLSLEADVYEMGLDRKMHRFETWDEQLKSYNYDKAQSFFEILVPTSDTTKYQFILKTLTGAGANVLITGETGVGKSVITKDFLMNPPNESIVSSFINFSGKTTTKNLQDAFEGNLDAKRRDLLGPPAGKQMVFFIDDVNMPQLDTYFSQPPVELLRQTID